ncbi:hypothetical protein [Paramagnetospirillum magneticum]|uniref:hypothetical protein n=1 Tax=Paramagnetospirillum magneticum TaxID=84159 RepID=UPI0011D09523|nr:hypothetical protein [Paramagnetospirillum magneticum]
MTTQSPTDEDVRRAAEELIARYGFQVALEDAKRRADVFAQDGRWPDHSTAMRILTVVEQLAGDAR